MTTVEMIGSIAAGVGVVVALAGPVVKWYVRKTDKRMDSHSEKLDNLGSDVGELKVATARTEERVQQIQKTQETTNSTILALDQHIRGLR